MDGIILVEKVQFLSNLIQVWSSKVYNINLSNLLQYSIKYVGTYLCNLQVNRQNCTFFGYKIGPL